MDENKTKKKVSIPIIIFIIASIGFALPSIIYFLENKTIYKFYYVWTYLFRFPTSSSEKILNAMLFFTIFTILFLAYIFILKKHNKILKNKKTLFIVIAIVSVLFAMIIPYTSTDVYSYIANGWSAAHYGENPYYVSTGEIVDATGQNEPMFNKVANCWRYETVVYGPLWTAICTVLSWLSFGNIDIALLIFKIANLLVHLINCVLIYKITRKRLFVIMYGLNPFILFEALSNVHNDIFIILFILLAIYFAIKRKNLFVSVIFIALATAIKYLAILILPFIILYMLRKKSVKERIKYCILCGIEYLAIIALIYLFYAKDIGVFAGLFMQQAKYNRSIFYVFYEYLGEGTTSIMQKACLAIFAIIYAVICIRLLFQKEIKFSQVIRRYNKLLLVFTFVLITNFNAWYIMWLFPTIFWLKSKSQETILALSYSSQIANFASFALWSEEAWLGIPYLIIMLLGTGIIKLLNTKIEKTKDGKFKVI